jgi:hypothetical protein
MHTHLIETCPMSHLQINCACDPHGPRFLSNSKCLSRDGSRRDQNWQVGGATAVTRRSIVIGVAYTRGRCKSATCIACTWLLGFGTDGDGSENYGYGACSQGTVCPLQCNRKLSCGAMTKIILLFKNLEHLQQVAQNSTLKINILHYLKYLGF